MGALDPVSVQIDGGPELSLETPADGPKIAKIIHQLQISDKDIGVGEDSLFGLRNTDRTRGLQLFRAGHVVSNSFRIRSGHTRLDRRPVWIVSADCVASQRSRVYNVNVVFSKDTGKALDKPYGSCECVAHLGWCSHQLAVGFLFTNFLKTFPLTTTSEEFCRVYPPNVFLAQREGCPWSYAVTDITEKLKCFDNLKWRGKRAPKSMRDTAELLIPRVEAWKDRWLQQTNAPDKRHAFAAAQVG